MFYMLCDLKIALLFRIYGRLEWMVTPMNSRLSIYDEYEWRTLKIGQDINPRWFYAWYLQVVESLIRLMREACRYPLGILRMTSNVGGIPLLKICCFELVMMFLKWSCHSTRWHCSIVNDFGPWPGRDWWRYEVWFGSGFYLLSPRLLSQTFLFLNNPVLLNQVLNAYICVTCHS